VTRYKLPEILGGGEFDRDAVNGPVLGVDYFEFLLAGVGRISVPGNACTEVPPSVPAEPEPGAYHIGGKICVRAWVHQSILRWFAVDEGIWWTWPGLVEHLGGPDVPITALVPALPEVELPWSLMGGMRERPWSLGVDISLDGRVAVSTTVDQRGGIVMVYAVVAEAMAAALLTAARAARGKP